jgi:hypothetical protein
MIIYINFDTCQQEAGKSVPKNEPEGFSHLSAPFFLDICAWLFRGFERVVVLLAAQVSGFG